VEDVAPPQRGLRLASAWLPVVAYAAMIFYFSSRPGRGLPRWWFMRYDKVLHAGEYFWFGALLARALWMSGLKLGRAAWAAIVLGVAFGVTDEFHQTFVPGRQGNDPGDLTADTLGSALGAGALALAGRRLVHARAVRSSGPAGDASAAP
jgi:VanZ family protein